jgi:peptide chain release factor subunit 1
LQAVIVNICDVSYGGENGFNQAIELSTDILANVKFIQEKKLIAKCVLWLHTRAAPTRDSPALPSLRRYFDEISQDTGKFCFGVEDTLQCLDMGAVETLIVWENLEINRHVLMNTATSETLIKYLTLEQEKDTSHFVDKDTGAHRQQSLETHCLCWH